MTIQDLIPADLFVSLSGAVLNAFFAVAALIAGWIIAMVVSAIVRNVLRRTGLDDRLNAIVATADGDGSIQVAQWVSKIVFWLVMLLVIAGLLTRYGAASAAEPIQALVQAATGYIPGLIGAGALLVAAWVVATFVRFVVTRFAESTNIDERLSQQADLGDQPLSVSDSLASVSFWLAFLLFVPGILNQLRLPGLENTFNSLTGPVFAAIPNLLAAVILLVIGWIAARVVRQVVTNILIAAGADQLGERVGMTPRRTLSGLAGTIAYAFVIIPISVAALDKLGFGAGPAATMLNGVMAAIPNILGAAILLAVAYFAGNFVADLVASILANVGLNRMPGKLGLADPPAEGARSLSDMVGYVTLVAVMLFAASAAANMMGFDSLVKAVDSVLALGGDVLLGVAILVLGIYLSRIASDVVMSSAGANGAVMANLARWAILLTAVAMALGGLEQGGDIIQTAFQALVYAVAFAAALAFGLGGRDAAAARLAQWTGADASADDADAALSESQRM